MRYCPKCDNELDGGAQVCRECGAAVYGGGDAASRSGSGERAPESDPGREGRPARGHEGQPANGGERRSAPEQRSESARGQNNGPDRNQRGRSAGRGPRQSGETGKRGRRAPDRRADASTSRESRRGLLKYGAAALGLLAAGGAAFVLADDSGSDPEKGAARSVVRENLRAFSQEDVDLLRETIHPEAPSSDDTVHTSRRLFQQYELRYDLTINGVEIDGDEARVEFTQTTRSDDPEFRDNRLKGVHVLRKYDGEWRIYDTQQEDVTYLE